MFLLDETVHDLPQDVQIQLHKIDEMDLYEFKEGLDSDSHSFIYKNALNQFKYENDNIIQLNSSLTVK